MEFIDIILGVIVILLSLVMAVVSRFLRVKISDSAWASTIRWVEFAVEAAEQIMKGVPDAGEEKYRIASDMIDELGLDEWENEVLIEAAVKRMNDGKVV